MKAEIHTLKAIYEIKGFREELSFEFSIKERLKFSDKSKIKPHNINLLSINSDRNIISVSLILSWLNGIFNCTYIKKEHQEFAKNNLMKCVPSNWTEEYIYVGLPLELSIRTCVLGCFAKKLYEIYLDGKKVDLTSYTSLENMDEELKEYRVLGDEKELHELSHDLIFKTNKLFKKLQRQEKKLKSMEK